MDSIDTSLVATVMGSEQVARGDSDAGVSGHGSLTCTRVNFPMAFASDFVKASGQTGYDSSSADIA